MPGRLGCLNTWCEPLTLSSTQPACRISRMRSALVMCVSHTLMSVGANRSLLIDDSQTTGRSGRVERHAGLFEHPRFDALMVNAQRFKWAHLVMLLSGRGTWKSPWK